jgi:hypothetical protein
MNDRIQRDRGLLIWEQSSRSVKQTTHLYLMQSLRKDEALPSLTLYALIL